MRESTNTREALLNTAERLVVEQGVKSLTIAGVAAAAGVSRGGVFYHFPTKEALIQAMVARLVEQFQHTLDRAVATDPDPHGRFTRAYARITMLEDQAVAQQIGSVMGALLAGLSYNPRLLDPLHERLQRWQRQSETELDPTTAAIVRLTAHALWTNDMFLTNKLDWQQRQQIVRRLEELTRAPTSST